jgi:flavin-dependent dehydrogenase
MPADRVLVVGGGPAGLAAAIACRLSGLRVTVLDPARPPIDKACGEGLMPDALAALEALGVSVPEGFPFSGIVYRDGETVAKGLLPSPGRGVRRTALHAALVARAEQLGVALDWGIQATGILVDAVRTPERPLSADWIVGADGLHSRMRGWMGPGGRPGRRQRFGVRRHYRIAPWSDSVEVHWGDRGEAYVTPVSAGLVNVAMLWSGEAAGFDSLFGDFPALFERLAGVESDGPDLGAGPFSWTVSEVARGNVALIGDAAGYVDPITGEGLAIAFHEALALAPALAAGNLAPYERASARLRAFPEALTRLVLSSERRPALRRRMVGALAARHDLFSRILAIQARAQPVGSFGLSGLWGLFRELLHERLPRFDAPGPVD